MDIKNEILWRIYAVMIILIIMAVVIFIRTAQIQIVEGPYWKAKRDSIHVSLRPIKGERGSIMARDGSLMASSLPFYEIRMDTKAGAMTPNLFDDNVDTLAACLMPWVKDRFSTKEDFKANLQSARIIGNRYYLIAARVTYPELEKIRSFPLFKLGTHKGGLIVNRLSRRSKPFKMLARRTIGYVSSNGSKVGLEERFDEYLEGDSEMHLMQKAGNAWIPLEDISDIEPKRGSDIVTTIDIDIQNIAGNALLKAMKTHQASSGCAIVMDVKTGAIRAIANLGKRPNGSYYEDYNYAVGIKTEPGSTFKLATIMALLEDGFVDLEDTIELNEGQYEFYGEEMKDASYHRMDSATVRTAFEISSNVGLAQMAFNNYETKGKRTQFLKRLEQFHLHRITDIEITGEEKPYIKSPGKEKDKWSGTTIPWMAIGYELELTPLQLLTLYNSVANNGKMMKPYLVSEIQRLGKTIESFEPEVLDEAIAKPSTIDKAQQLLEGVVENGTANNIKPRTYRIAGKTGTAQTNYSKIKKGERLKYQASFAGYFPANNPAYSCIVVITEPTSGQFYGSQVAAPVFKEIADKCYVKETKSQIAINQNPKVDLTHRQLPVYSLGYRADFFTALNYLDLNYNKNVKSDWIVMDIDSSSMLLQSQIERLRKVVPNVVGMGLRDAVYKMEEKGIQVRVVNGKGKVKSQSVKAGRTVRMGMEVYLTLG
ncbi:MAG: cell division protein FtsI (penicillin-binding protein 3) [Cognaticolwellia sp.]|jgi:cell division protein FtsI (penicillin-binding protein 3)